jgi:SRSO17 transposase
LEGLLLPTERNKTLTGLAHTEPVLGAQHAIAQRFQWFLTESTWAPDAVNQRRFALLGQTPATAPHAGGVLVIDETGDRKWGTKTAHVGRQYLGSIGKIDNGVVSVSSLWADDRVYYPLDDEPYTPAHWFAKGKNDTAFRTKPTIAIELGKRAQELTMPFRAVVADAFYGSHLGFREDLDTLGVPYVLAEKPSHAWWHPEGEVGAVPTNLPTLPRGRRRSPAAGTRSSVGFAMDTQNSGGSWKPRGDHTAGSRPSASSLLVPIQRPYPRQRPGIS